MILTWGKLWVKGMGSTFLEDWRHQYLGTSVVHFEAQYCGHWTPVKESWVKGWWEEKHSSETIETALTSCKTDLGTNTSPTTYPCGNLGRLLASLVICFFISKKSVEIYLMKLLWGDNELHEWNWYIMSAQSTLVSFTAFSPKYKHG